MNVNKLKIGLVSFHSFHNPGGVKNHIIGLYKEFKKRKIPVKVIVPRRSATESYGKDFILLGTSLPIPFNAAQADLVINFNPFSIKKVLDKEQFDILHLHNFSLPSGLEILAYSEATHVLTFHANLDKSEFLRNFPIFLSLFEKVVNWKIHGIIGVAPLVLEIFKNYKGPKLVIPNGIDTEQFHPGNPPISKFRDSKIHILFVGRIEERKGLMYLLRAYELLQKRFDNLRLLIVGEGEKRKECEDFVKTRNLQEVYFVGQKTEENLLAFYATADIFCSPALYGESFGIVLLEAMASGLPVVAFANRGYQQFLGKKKGGELLIKPKDWKGLAEKIEILIKDKKLREEMGKWGIEEAKNYAWPKVTDQVLDFYEEVLRMRKLT